MYSHSRAGNRNRDLLTSRQRLYHWAKWLRKILDIKPKCHFEHYLYINSFNIIKLGSKLFLTPLHTAFRDVRIKKFLWTTYSITDTVGVTPLTCCQQIAEASSKDNIGQNLNKWTDTLGPYIPCNNSPLEKSHSTAGNQTRDLLIYSEGRYHLAKWPD